MIKNQSRYIDSIENALRNVPNALFFNTYILKRIGLPEWMIKGILSCQTLVYYVIWLLSFVVCSLDFLRETFRNVLNSKNGKESLENEDVMLFFTHLFWSRSQASGIFERSKYWLLSPEIKSNEFDLSSKVIIDYRQYSTLQKCWNAYTLSLAVLFQLLFKKERLFIKMFGVYQYHFCQICMVDIVKNNNIYFSNQSDRWALMFDTIPSRKKVLLQHGIDSDQYEIPHKLKHIDIFYAISKSSWQNSYYSNLDCKPDLRFMNSTIQLEKMETSHFLILIISNLAEIKNEERALQYIKGLKNVDIYLKKHPTESIECYKPYQMKYGFNFVQDNCFPKVDFVISYFSTLAYEYSAHDIPVYMYTNVVDLEILKKLLKNSYDVYQRINTK